MLLAGDLLLTSISVDEEPTGSSLVATLHPSTFHELALAGRKEWKGSLEHRRHLMSKFELFQCTRLVIGVDLSFFRFIIIQIPIHSPVIISQVYVTAE